MTLQIGQPVVAFNIRAVIVNTNDVKQIIDALRDRGYFVMVYSILYSKYSMMSFLSRNSIQVDGVDREAPENIEHCINQINDKTKELLEQLKRN